MIGKTKGKARRSRKAQARFASGQMRRLFGDFRPQAESFSASSFAESRNEVGRRSQKGQAAMEYLMTYGWAILVIIIIMGALIYLGVLGGGSGAIKICRFATGDVFCTSAKTVADTSNGAKVSLEIQNTAPGPIYLKGYGCTMEPNPANPISVTFASAKLVVIGAKETLPISGADYAVCKDESGNSLLNGPGENFRGRVYLAYCTGNDCVPGAVNYNVISGSVSGKLETE
ncbi:Uncharacterised protein [Candidatus Gugararchaeum adminiculabundum]|nr:Uncharacterised protein [Candidatus Gugararchaeum adminiculabundum]